MTFSAQAFLLHCKENRFQFFTGTPCSYLRPFINSVIDDHTLHYRAAPNEGDAVAMAAGAYVAGQKGVVIFQNSGLGNAVNALTSLCYPFRIPLLLIVTHRGEPGGEKDEPQHELMGQITKELLDVMHIPHLPFPKSEDELPSLFQYINNHFVNEETPLALIMSKGDISDYELQSPKFDRSLSENSFSYTEKRTITRESLPLRNEVLKQIIRYRKSDDIIVATTGYTGRELYALEDHPQHFYMVGSMGSASSFALGMALTANHKRIIILDGDSAAIMRMGNFSAIGHFAPPNLIHIVLDNGLNESTGGQPSLSYSLSFGAIAQASGYRSAENVESLSSLENYLEQLPLRGNGPHFLHVPINSGTPAKLPRPHMTPLQVRVRIQEVLQ